MQFAIIIPAFNEASVIESVIKSIPRKISGIKTVSVVVDDGSSDDTFAIAEKYADYTIRHKTNLGQGAALTTGFEFLKRIDCQIAITMDADGQHSASDLEKLVVPVLNDEADVVNGSRMFKPKGMPLFKIFANLVMNLITLVVFGIWISDSQSGMRAFSKKAYTKIKLSSLGHEICSEIIGEIKRNKLKLKEIPIKVIYTKYSKRKGQSWLNGVNIITKIITIKLTDTK